MELERGVEGLSLAPLWLDYQLLPASQPAQMHRPRLQSCTLLLLLGGTPGAAQVEALELVSKLAIAEM